MERKLWKIIMNKGTNKELRKGEKTEKKVDAIRNIG